jgi:CheY-like chemotaxis protein
MLSLRTHPTDRVKGLRHGADEYVCKPFDPEELLLRLDKLLVERSPDEALFRGRLETVTLPEVIQSLLNGAREGVLEVWTPTGRGRVELANSCVVSAGFGRLSGVDAVLAMLDVRGGTFKFREREPGEAPGESRAAPVPLEPVIFTSAWLDDELRRWPPIAPDARLVPAAETAEAVPSLKGYESLPFDAVWQAMTGGTALTMRDLLKQQISAPRRVELAVRLLVHRGDVETSAAVPASGAANHEDVVPEGEITGAVDRLVKTACARGFASEAVPILLLVEPTVRQKLERFLDSLPDSVRVPPAQSSRVILSAGRLAEFEALDGKASLAVHVASLASEVVLERVWSGIQSYAAVAVWVESDLLVQEVEWIVDRLEKLSTSQWGLLMASSDAAVVGCEAAVRRATRWMLQAVRPTGLMQVVDQLASAGTVVALA